MEPTHTGSDRRFDRVFNDLPLIWRFLVNEGRKHDLIRYRFLVNCILPPNEDAIYICKSLPGGHDLISKYGITNDGLGLGYTALSIYGRQYLCALRSATEESATRSARENSTDFLKSVKDDHFVDALKDVTISIGDDRKDAISRITDDIEPQEKDELLKYLGTITPDELDEIIKSTERKRVAKRRGKRATENKNSLPKPLAPEILKKYWLPFVLWNKTTAEILEAIPALSSGDKAEDHDRDCNTIDRAVQRLKWTRYPEDKLS